MPTIHLLTWNLKNRDAALKALAKHVASQRIQKRHFLVAVQECADDAAAIIEQVRSFDAEIHAVGNGTMSVLCSVPLESPPIPYDPVGQRLVMTRASFDGQRLAIVNYHGMAQGLNGSPDPTERGGIASEARWRIDEYAGQDPVVVLGDFNEQPTESEIVSQHCFSFAQAPGYGATRSHNRDRKDLRVVTMNPPLGGTYFFRSSTRGAFWCTLDFIATSPRLANHADVLSMLNGVPLTNGAEPTMSDHLPVVATLELP